jgi:hypothetical protein
MHLKLIDGDRARVDHRRGISSELLRRSMPTRSRFQ